MRITEADLKGVHVIETLLSIDERGVLCKTFSECAFHQAGLSPLFKEFLYTFTRQNTIRGMHFQLPPYEQDKLVFAIKGSVIDVVLDLRKESDSYGMWYAIELSEKNARALYVPYGFAHGFLSVGEENIVGYLITTVYSEDHDAGVRWDSFGYSWQCDSPILSNKDRNLQRFEEFDSPF